MNSSSSTAMDNQIKDFFIIYSPNHGIIAVISE